MSIKCFILATIAVMPMIGCTTPSDSIPSVTSASKSAADIKQITTKSRSGSFVAAEHPTSGRVSIISESGRNLLEFDQSFKTDSGPDLFVILHRSPDVLKVTKPPSYALKEGDYLAIAPLQSISGKQRYEIPKNIQVNEYNSVSIWCRQFNATFGTASLS